MAQSFIPPFDVRIAYAMETHGVETSLLNLTPSARALEPPGEHSKEVLYNLLPLR